MTEPQLTSIEQIRMIRDQLASIGVPQSEAQALQQIRVLEDFKIAVSALQARDTELLEQNRFNKDDLDDDPLGCH